MGCTMSRPSPLLLITANLSQAWVDLSASTACGWSKGGQRSPTVSKASADVFFALMQGSLEDVAAGALEVFNTLSSPLLP